MNFETQLKQLWKQYQFHQNTFFMFKRPEKLIHQTISLIRDFFYENGFSAFYNGEQLKFETNKQNTRNVDLLFENMAAHHDGFYSYNSENVEITLNTILLKCDIRTVIGSSHEALHSIQDDLCHTIDEYDQQSSKYKYLTALNAAINSVDNKKIFDIPIAGPTHIRNPFQTLSPKLDDLNDAIYKLSITERYVYNTTAKMKSILLNQPIDLTNYKKSIDIIKKQYNCEDLSDREICQLIDNAHVNIFYDKEPQSFLEASITYDLAALISYANGHIMAIDLLNLTQRDKKHEILAQHNYLTNEHNNIFGPQHITNDLELLEYIQLKDIAKLSHGQLINNPQIIISGILNYKNKMKDLIPSVQALKDWCYSKYNHYDNYVMQEIAQVLGPDFSPEKCKEQQELNAQKEQAEIERRRAKIEKLNEKYIERYHFDDFDFDNPIDLRSKKQKSSWKEIDKQTFDDGPDFDGQKIDFDGR